MFGFEKYLCHIANPKFRVALTRFRLSSHNLAIETGRFVNIDREDRICMYCRQGAIENEYHFLLICPFYSDIRAKYLPRYYNHWPTLNKFDKLMAVESKSKGYFSSCKYIYYASVKRDDAILV